MHKQGVHKLNLHVLFEPRVSGMFYVQGVPRTQARPEQLSSHC